MTDYESLTDAELVAACKEGKAAAWDALVTRYERLVYTVPLRYGLSSAEADDVFQSVWAILLKHLSTIRQPDRISAWLVTTARRECWDRRRGAEHERTSTLAPAELSDVAATWTESASPEEIVARFEAQQTVRAALRQLRKRCRQLLYHLYSDPANPAYEEIARSLKMAVGSIGPTRARCLKKLREILEQQGG